MQLVGFIIRIYHDARSPELQIINNKFTINNITVYITTASLCNLYCYMFRHCHVTIRQFTISTLLSYIGLLFQVV